MWSKLNLSVCLLVILTTLYRGAEGLDVTATINVAQPGKPDQGRAGLGTPVTITCTFTGLKLSTLRFLEKQQEGDTWISVFENGVLGAQWPQGDYEIRSNIDDDTATAVERLTMTAAGINDAGKYRCRIAQPAGSEKSVEITLQVFAQTAQVMMKKGEGKEAIEGEFLNAAADDELSVWCIAVNGSEPTMKLLMDGEVKANIDVAAVENTYEGEARITFGGGDDGKQIQCESQVETFDPVRSSPVTLRIVAPPSIQCSPKTQKGKKNAEVKFTCTVSGKPIPDTSSLIWTKSDDGTSVGGDESNQQAGMSSKVTNKGDSLEVVLTVKVTDFSFTKYTLTASNINGDTTETVEIAIDTNQGTVGDGGGGASTQVISMVLLLFSVLLALL